MREFKILPKVKDFELDMIEEIVSEKLPSQVRAYIKKYGGSSIDERYFRSKDNLTWELSQFNKFDDLYGLTKEFLEGYKRKLVPFAYDPGGWHFCLCMDEGQDYGAIIINRWTDHLPEEQFLKIADSFEEFINGLKAEETT
ncbi:MAG: SMI1/KNR4 family protein [Cyclobacteriaceae bacterium]